MKKSIGSEGTEQFTVTTWQNGKLMREQEIHDPFIRSTVVIQASRWDLFKALFQRQHEMRIEIHVNGTEGAQRAIMTLDPAQLQRDTEEILEQRRISRENSPTVGHYVEPKP